MAVGVPRWVKVPKKGKGSARLPDLGRNATLSPDMALPNPKRRMRFPATLLPAVPARVVASVAGTCMK